MKKTPRTNEVLARIGNGEWCEAADRPADFASTLEHELATKDALIAQLHQALQNIMPFVPDGYIEIPPIKKAAYDALAATSEIAFHELAELREDKARLDWLAKSAHIKRGNCDIDSRSYYCLQFTSGWDYYAPGDDKPFRAAIDAARKAAP